jgi:hypothetical protein
MIKTLFFSVWFLFHPVHVTLTSIDYFPERDSLKVFIKLYLDDFLLDMGINNDNTAITGFSHDNPQSKVIMENYLNNKLILRVNKRLISGKLNDFAIVDNEVKLNFGYSQVRNPEVIIVKNLIMTDLYKDQSNLVIIKVYEFEEGIKLTSDCTEKTFKIKESQ